MTPNQLTEAAQRASERYTVMTGAFRGALVDAVGRNPADMRSRASLKRACLDIALVYLRGEIENISYDVDDAAQDETDRFALSYTGSTVRDDMSALTLDTVALAKESLETELRAQIERDINQVLSRFKDFQIETHMLADSERISLNAAKLRVQMKGETKASYYFRDRIGRRFESRKFVRAIWRNTLLQVGNEAFMISAAKAGFLTLVVDHPDQASNANGTRISLGAQPADSYASIRDTIFHPNSQARLVLP